MTVLPSKVALSPAQVGKRPGAGEAGGAEGDAGGPFPAGEEAEGDELGATTVKVLAAKATPRVLGLIPPGAVA